MHSKCIEKETNVPKSQNSAPEEWMEHTENIGFVEEPVESTSLGLLLLGIVFVFLIISGLCAAASDADLLSSTPIPLLEAAGVLRARTP
uniref:Small integral membrane protein 33 n=1 Tax=Steinernema glaseri TaxID=37863 RepID=A0A1I7YMQ6_9BILA